jgi:hypothetical protein
LLTVNVNTFPIEPLISLGRGPLQLVALFIENGDSRRPLPFITILRAVFGQ